MIWKGEDELTVRLQVREIDWSVEDSKGNQSWKQDGEVSFRYVDFLNRKAGHRVTKLETLELEEFHSDE